VFRVCLLCRVSIQPTASSRKIHRFQHDVSQSARKERRIRFALFRHSTRNESLVFDDDYFAISKDRHARERGEDEASYETPEIFRRNGFFDAVVSEDTVLTSQLRQVINVKD